MHANSSNHLDDTILRVNLTKLVNLEHKFSDDTNIRKTLKGKSLRNRPNLLRNLKEQTFRGVSYWVSMVRACDFSDLLVSLRTTDVPKIETFTSPPSSLVSQREFFLGDK